MDIVERITKFLNERAKVRGLDQEQIAGLHVGDEREALLLAPDLRAVLDEIARLRDENESLRGSLEEWKLDLNSLRDENAKLKSIICERGSNG